MTSMQFEVIITAAGEVRDADGNLISTQPVEGRMVLTAAQLAELGITPPEGND